MTDPPAAGAVPRRWTAADRWWAAAVPAVALLLYARTVGYGFIYLDDQAYVADNPYVRHGLSWAGARWAFTGTTVDNWHPLTLLVSMALSTAFGPSAGTFHAANAVVFAACGGLLFAFLRSATGRTGPSAATAVLWAVHPLRVESVAWVAELKDELSGAAWLGCLLAYVAYARRRTAGRYAAVAATLGLALLSKPVAVTLPAVLLLTDAWPLNGASGRRWWAQRVAEKVPLLAMSAAVAAATVLAQARPATLVALPRGVRAANAVVSVAAYLRQTVWPVGLAVFYPHPYTLRHPIPTASTVAATTLIVFTTVATLVAGRRRPYLPVGWAWFLVVLLPVLGLLQAGDQARADRFTFLPSIGLTAAAVWLAADRLAGRRAVATGLAVAVAAPLAVATWVQVGTWASVDTAWAHADAVVPDNYLARCFLAQLALRDGDPARAERYARSAVDLVPGRNSEGRLALARALDREGRPADARPQFAAAVRIAPDDPMARMLFGQFLDRQGDRSAAREQLARAVRLDPALTAARRALAESYAADGRWPEAAAAYDGLLARSPDDADARRGLAAARRSATMPAAPPAR